MRRPSKTASAGSGTVSITASPIVLTWLPPAAGSSAPTASQKSATNVAASSSPWVSVSAVKPAMSANRKVVVTVALSRGCTAASLSPSTLEPGTDDLTRHHRRRPGRSSSLARLRHVEAEHHPALVVLGDVAVGHPPARVGDVEQDVDDLTGAHQDGVGPHQVGLDDVVAAEHEEAAGAVDVERVVHRVVGVHLVDEADLHPVANRELPRDRVVL